MATPMPCPAPGTVVHPDVGHAGHGVHQRDPTRRGLFEEVGDLRGRESGSSWLSQETYRYVEMCRKYTLYIQYIYIILYILCIYII